MLIKKIKSNNSGFTLIEMLVTVGVFAIVMMVSSSIFINVNNLQQQTANMGKLQNEGRYVLEKIGKEIRGRELDYDAMKNLIGETTGLTKTLIFKPDEFGETYEISYIPNESIVVKSTDGTEKSAPLSSDEVMVEQLQFRIWPITDPYGPSSGQLVQPRVTIMMIINNRDVPEKYQKTLQLQTTISSKVYK